MWNIGRGKEAIYWRDRWYCFGARTHEDARGEELLADLKKIQYLLLRQYFYDRMKNVRKMIYCHSLIFFTFFQRCLFRCWQFHGTIWTGTDFWKICHEYLGKYSSDFLSPTPNNVLKCNKNDYICIHFSFTKNKKKIVKIF